MKKVFATLVLALLVTTFSFAQTDAQKNATKIAKFEAGKALTKADMGFLNVVVSGPDKMRGASDAAVTIDSTKYATGTKLTQKDADKLNKKAAAYGKAHKDDKADATRGAICYYYYCDGYGNCYYVYYRC